ncbi:MAG TPA: ATP-binding protein [Planctomycetaceae bacterium]|nr:ATP-binding protein [Planctomycetaceae bacterium]
MNLGDGVPAGGLRVESGLGGGGTPAPAVLVIDDDAGTCRSVQRILRLDGYRVDLAGTAAEALARDNWDEYMAVLLDRRLPDGSAEELLPEIRRRAPEAAVLVVTGFGDLDSSIAALRAGAADYLLKPVEPETLRARIRQLAELRRARDFAETLTGKLVQSERLAAIGQMVTGLAHESRNALQRAQACLDMLELDLADQPELLDLTGRTRKALVELHRLYEEVRSYAAPLHLELAACNLAELWRQTWAEVIDVQGGRSVCLREQGAASTDLAISIDRHRIEQVLRNIFENAVAVCLEPGVVTVQWAGTKLGGRDAVQIAVIDNGPGLTPEQQQGIFEPFFTTKTRGTGLGMAISKRIVEAHGGTLEARNAAAGGAEITVTLLRTP